MTHYLKDKNGNVIVAVETTLSEINSVVCIKNYSNFLISSRSKNYYHTISTIQDFDELQELRGEWFEESPCDHYENTDDFVERRLKEVAGRHGLYYVTD